MSDRLLNYDEKLGAIQKSKSTQDFEHCIAKAQDIKTAAAINAEWVEFCEKYEKEDELFIRYRGDTKNHPDKPSIHYIMIPIKVWQERKRSVGL